MNNSTRVFILEKPAPNFDISSLDEWGDVVVLFNRICSPLNKSEFGERLLSQLKENLFNSEKDYFVVLGKSCRIVAASSIILATGDQINLLMYTKEKNKYVEWTLFSNLEKL